MVGIVVNSDSLLEALPAGVVVHGSDSRIRYANPCALALLRLSAGQAMGRDALDPAWQFLDIGRKRLRPALYPVNLVLASRQRLDHYVIGITDASDAEATWVLVNAYPEFDAEGAIDSIVVCFTDVTHDRRDIPFEQIVANASDAVVVTEADPANPRIVFVNKAFTEVTGYGGAEAYGKTPSMLQGAGTDQGALHRVRVALDAGQAVHETVLNFSKTGRPYWLDMKIVPLRNSAGEVIYFAAIERDITDVKRREQSLTDLANHDPLTRLLNRRGFSDLAERVAAKAGREQSPVSVGMIDIDFFKNINDEHGHGVGDLALQHMAALMHGRFRDCDVLGRLGGEEFAILLAGTGLALAARLLEQFRAGLAAAPLVLADGRKIFLNISVGVAAAPDAEPDVASLIGRADRALYDAKHAGRNQVVIAA